MHLKFTRREMIDSSVKAALSCFLIPSMVLEPKIKWNSMEKQLIKKTIPASGEKIPAIGMGTWQTFDVGNSPSKRSNLEEILKLFVDSGGKMIDSSPMYGSSEEVVGALASKLGLHPELFMATKVWTTGEEKGRQQMQESMKLLKVSKIDLMQVHNLVDYKVHLETLREWKEEGRINYHKSDLRLQYWDAALTKIKENPIFGHGTGDAQLKLRQEYIKKGLSDYLNYHAHNQYLQTLLEQGLLGLFFLLLPFFIVLHYSKKENIKIFLAITTYILLCFLTESYLLRQNGTVFVSFFLTLFLFNLTKRYDQKLIQPTLLKQPLFLTS